MSSDIAYFYHKSTVKDHPTAEDYTEKGSLDLFITGNTYRKTWNSRSVPTDFYHLKSYLEMVLSRLGIKPESLDISESSKKYFAESITYLQ